MATRLPSDVRMLVADAESQAKRHGHGEVTPLHLIAALNARGLAEDHFPNELLSAVDARLRTVQPDYTTPTPDQATKALLTQVAADKDPMAR